MRLILEVLRYAITWIVFPADYNSNSFCTQFLFEACGRPLNLLLQWRVSRIWWMELAWLRHDIDTMFALMTLCEGSPPDDPELRCFLTVVWWTNSRFAGDLRHLDAHMTPRQPYTVSAHCIVFRFGTDRFYSCPIELLSGTFSIFFFLCFVIYIYIYI